MYMWEFPKIRGTFLGVPIIRTIVFLGSILGSPYLGKLPCTCKHMRAHVYSVLLLGVVPGQLSLVPDPNIKPKAFAALRV